MAEVIGPKLGLSKPKNGKRFLMLSVPRNQYGRYKNLVQEQLLGQAAYPAVITTDTECKFIFHMDYLPRILLLIPHADVSAKLDELIVEQMKDELAKIPVPKLRIPWLARDKKLFDFQLQGIDFLVKELLNRGRMTAGENDGLGLGKTIQCAIAMLMVMERRPETAGPILVTTTNSGKWSWAKIFRAWLPDVTFEVVDGIPRQRSAALQADVQFVFANVETVRGVWTNAKDGHELTRKSKTAVFQFNNPDIASREWAGYIFDESHKFKNPTSQQTRGFLQLPPANYEIFASSTPFLNRPQEYWPALHRMDPKKYPTAYAMEQSLMVVDGGDLLGYNVEGMQDLKAWLQVRTIRRRREQVGVQMPKVMRYPYEVDLTPEQRKIYNRIRDDMKLQMDDGSLKSIPSVLAQITRLKQACWSPELFGGSRHSAKMDALTDIIAELVANNQKAILFSQFAEACKIMRREFGELYDAAYVTGEVSGTIKIDGIRVARRSLQEDKFNLEDDCKLYIGTTAANQESITLSAGNNVALTDKLWTPMANDQAVGRSAAGGLRGIGTTSVNVIELIARNTFEERIEERLGEKRAVFNSVMEKDGGERVMRMTIKDIRELL